MMKQTFAIEVIGKTGRTFSFNFKGDPQYLDEWRSEGFVVHEVVNSIPVWAQQMGLTHLWCAVQDAWRLLRLW